MTRWLARLFGAAEETQDAILKLAEDGLKKAVEIAPAYAQANDRAELMAHILKLSRSDKESDRIHAAELAKSVLPLLGGEMTLPTTTTPPVVEQPKPKQLPGPKAKTLEEQARALILPDGTLPARTAGKPSKARLLAEKLIAPGKDEEE